MAEQPRLDNQPAEFFGQHVDDYAPGLLNREQWSARSDIWHHTGDLPAWERDAPGDPLFHVGTQKAAEERGNAYHHKFRVPQRDVASGRESDVGANMLHASFNHREGYPVSDSVMESMDAPGYGESPDLSRLSELSRGYAIPYTNTAEDSGSTSLLVPQKTARTWAEDVLDQRNEAWRNSSAPEPSSMMQDAAEALGTTGEIPASADDPNPLTYGKRDWSNTQVVLQDQQFPSHEWGSTASVYQRYSPKQIVGKAPLAAKTYGGEFVHSPKYEGTGVEIANAKRAESKVLASDMERLLGPQAYGK